MTVHVYLLTPTVHTHTHPHTLLRYTPISPSLPLSLTLSPTHTHTYTRFKALLRQSCRSLEAGELLSAAAANTRSLSARLSLFRLLPKEGGGGGGEGGEEGGGEVRREGAD